VKVQFGEYGLKALEAAGFTNRQIEAARVAMTRKIVVAESLDQRLPRQAGDQEAG